jgi:hypothetical protein
MVHSQVSTLLGLIYMSNSPIGVYFDISFNQSTSIYIKLFNSPSSSENHYPTQTSIHPIQALDHLQFRANNENVPSQPLSILAQVDDDEYIVYKSASGLIQIKSNELDPQLTHQVRIIAPMTDNFGIGTIEVEGILLDKEAQIFWPKGSRDNNLEGSKDEDDNIPIPAKSIEIITDYLGALGLGKRDTTGREGPIGGVMGWEYLLGDMFGADHSRTAVDGMCLVQSCIGGVGTPVSLVDTFFRSGPRGAKHFSRPWTFSRSHPDVIVLNIGSSDALSFANHAENYSQSSWELSERFSDTYVSFVREIRQLAYASESVANEAAISKIPIFILRPFRGELEHATLGVVNRLREEGDKAVFWIDTSGWIVPDENIEDGQDLYLDKDVQPNKWRLTVAGNEKIAMYLHTHLCQYLSVDTSACPFLPAEVYQGQSFDPRLFEVERYIEHEKERKLKMLFVGNPRY